MAATSRGLCLRSERSSGECLVRLVRPRLRCRNVRYDAGDWKYIDDRGQHFLFDLRTDLGERQDLAQQHADRMRELRSLLATWEADVDAEARQRAATSR